MRVAQVTAMGGPDVLQVVEVPDPKPAPGQVLIRVEAAGVGPWDIKLRNGAFGPQKTPYVPGGELAGTIAAVGPGVQAFVPGAPVWAFPSITGATAELVVASVETVSRRPPGFSSIDAAGAAIGVSTAELALERLGLTQGWTLLVLAAGGNVGAFAVQLARQRGATVLAQAGRSDFDRLRSVGAAEVLDHKGDWVAAVRHFAREGVHALVDPLGGASRDSALTLLRAGGRAVSLLALEGLKPPRGVVLESISVAPDGARLTRLGAAFGLGALHANTGKTFPLSAIADAHRAYEAGTKGKIVVRMS